MKKVLSQVRILAQFPRSGRKVSEFDDDNVRKLIVYSYRVIDRIQKKKVVIAAVFDGKRTVQPSSKDSDPNL